MYSCKAFLNIFPGEKKLHLGTLLYMLSRLLSLNYRYFQVYAKQVFVNTMFDDIRANKVYTCTHLTKDWIKLKLSGN